MSPFLAWGDFHARSRFARSRFARSTIPEEKWGTTRSLEQKSQQSIYIFGDEVALLGLTPSFLAA